MQDYITTFIGRAKNSLDRADAKEIAKAINILQACYERDGRIYVCGNGGSLAMATHWVADFNKTVFSSNLGEHARRFQAIRLPSTEAELTAWANDVGFDMVFAGPLKNYIQESDVLVAISSSGSSMNVIKAAELAKSHNVPVIGLTGFDGGRLREIADAKIHVQTAKGDYFIVEGVHGVILHLIIRYFKDYFEHVAKREA